MSTKDPLNALPFGRVHLVIELAHLLHDGEAVWSVVASLPGREGTLTRRWRADGPRMTFRNMQDLTATVQLWIANAIVCKDGVQQELLGGDV